MKSKLTLATVAVALATMGSAGAADLGRPVLKAPPPPPPSTWTGFYIDGGFGYGLWAADTITISPVTGVCVLCVTQTQGGKGWFGTIGGGYDWQLGPSFVLGVLGGWDFASIKGTLQD